MILLKCDYYTNTFIHTNYTRMILLKCDYYTNTKYTRMILLKCNYYTNTFIHTKYTRMILLKCDYYTNTFIHTKYTRMILLKCDYLLNKQLNKMRRTSMVSSACTFTSMSNKVFCLRRRWCKGAVGCSYFLRLRYPGSNWYLPLLSTGLATVGW